MEHVQLAKSKKKFKAEGSHDKNNLFQNKDVTKESRNKCGKVGDYKFKRWAWWEKLGRGGGHGSKVVTWHGQ